MPDHSLCQFQTRIYFKELYAVYYAQILLIETFPLCSLIQFSIPVVNAINSLYVHREDKFNTLVIEFIVTEGLPIYVDRILERNQYAVIEQKEGLAHLLKWIVLIDNSGNIIEVEIPG